jgi:glycosyltransferase involved in cell wall biosynthesis
VSDWNAYVPTHDRFKTLGQSTNFSAVVCAPSSISRQRSRPYPIVPRLIRVVHLISGQMYGGGQKVALDLVEGLRTSRGANSELWLMGCRHGSLRERADFIANYDGNYSSPATLLRSACNVRGRLLSSSVDIVHSHGWDADAVAYLATLGRREMRVVHLHVTPAWIHSAHIRHGARRLLTHRIFAGKSVQVVAVASAVREHWTQVFDRLEDRTQVIYNAADAKRFRPAHLPPDSTGAAMTFGVACRLTPQKGLSVLIQALADASQRSSRIMHLKIAGEGPELDALQRLAHNLGIAHLVTFVGHIAEVDQFYQTLDALVLTAVSDEGMPLTILEAMASGLPVVTSDVGGSSEAVRDGIDGFVVRPNSPTAISDAMIELAAQPALRLSMGRSALERARSHFSLEAQIDAVAKVYLACLGRGHDDNSPRSHRHELDPDFKAHS